VHFTVLIYVGLDQQNYQTYKMLLKVSSPPHFALLGGVFLTLVLVFFFLGVIFLAATPDGPCSSATASSSVDSVLCIFQRKHEFE
jgi:hypothetical protein